MPIFELPAPATVMPVWPNREHSLIRFFKALDKRQRMLFQKFFQKRGGNETGETDRDCKTKVKAVAAKDTGHS